MTDKSQQGPASGVMASAQRIISIIVSMVESRVRLAVIELEEEKANLIQLLIMVGLTLLFAAFGIMSLIALIIWGIDPQYRLFALGCTTATLLGLALIGGIWTLVKVRRSTLLKATRKELATDRSLLEEDTK
ncbi:phage holin family protein [Pectobacterium jejuense]|uniref:Phage holin family protein n=1 Tax=Pectobacterium jejuense TaxID=2974022 RepID=A0ABW8GWF0_9GAMM|nr:phage holin family protein [Pectobacterium jejuense]MCY9848280.1 phage holin family protein [Pectobacterium jejuense]